MRFPARVHQSLICALAILEPREGRRLEVDQIRTRVESLAVLDVPCAYRIETRNFFVPLRSLPEDHEFAEVIAALRRFDDAPAPSIADVWPVFERRAREAALSPDGCWTRASRVTSTAELQVQNQIRPELDGILGRYRKGHVDLYVVAHPAAAQDASFPNQIVAQTPSSSPPVDDLRHVLRPLPIEREILDGWATCAWELHPAPGVDRILVRPRSAEGGHSIDFDAADGLPRRAATYFADPVATGSAATFVGLFEFGPAGAQDWIRRAIHLSIDPETIAVEIAVVDDVRFELEPADLLLEAPPHCVLFDYRSGQENYFGVDRTTWPLDVLLPLGVALPIDEATPSAFVPSNPPPAVGRTALAVTIVALLCGFAAFGWRRRRAAA